MLSPKGGSMDEQLELRTRRRAIRLWVKGYATHVILHKVNRSGAWFSKWRTRYLKQGWKALASRSRRPQHSPTAYSVRLRRLVVATRRQLVRAKIGLHGPRAIQRALRPLQIPGALPSLPTIKRILRQEHIVRPHRTRKVYFPTPAQQVQGVLHASDWTCRYLEAGVKVYAFHTLDLQTRACTQSIGCDKQIPTVRQHFLETWQTLGIPDYLQLDNDAAFCGGYKVTRVFGQIVRLCLHLGIEIIFLPVAEPERNGLVEQLNGLWQRAGWNRNHFRSVRAVQKTSPKFCQWYMTQYVPPGLGDATPQQVQRQVSRRYLTSTQAKHVPLQLGITAGHIHFIRQVQPDGTISLLNEVWRIGKRRAGKYVWATITTQCQRLEIWSQTSAQADWRLLKSWQYAIAEPIVRRPPEFKKQ
jgi:hypothetical protein